MAKEPVACTCQQVVVEKIDGNDRNMVGTGCTSTTRSKFAPGHDAKLKSLLIDAGVNGHMVSIIDSDGVESLVDALVAADRHGFHGQVEKGISLAREKAERKAARAAKAKTEAAE